MVEIICIGIAVCFMGIYIFKQKELHLMRLKKQVRQKRNKRFMDIKIEKKNKFLMRMIFISAVLTKKEFVYYAAKIYQSITVFILANMVFLFLILYGGTNITLRITILVLTNLFIYKLLYDLCLIKHKKDAHRYITMLQNETQQSVDIIHSAKEAVKKNGAGLLSNEIDLYLTSLIKNSKASGNTKYIDFVDMTFGYELSLISIFLSNSLISGDKTIIKRNLASMEKHFSIIYERSKDILFAKLPYVAIILLLPLFMYWMDSFGTAVMMQGAAANEPKEYIYIISITLSYLYSYI